MIPLIDLSPLFVPASAARDATDRAVLAAATGAGFITVTASPGLLPTDAATRAALLRVFTLPAGQRTPLLRRAFAPGRRAGHRGGPAARADAAARRSRPARLARRRGRLLPRDGTSRRADDA